MNSKTVPGDPAGAGRIWGGGKVKSSRAVRNSLSPIVSSGSLPDSAAWESSDDSAAGPWAGVPRFSQTPTARLLEVSCGLSEDQVLRLLEPSARAVPRPRPTDLEFESPSHHEAFSAVLLALTVAGLLAFALT